MGVVVERAPLVVALPPVAPSAVAPPLAEDREEVAPPSSLASGWLSSHGVEPRPSSV